jgi:hypothetical protein
MFPRQRATMVKRTTARSSDVGRWAEGMRASKRLWLLTFLGNVALLVGLLGLPYLRGKQRARTAWAHYDAFAHCLYGGELRRDLADPRPRAYLLGDEAGTFAARARAAGYTLAVRCREPLEAIAPADDFFVLPSLKRAETALREAVRVAARELTSLRQPLATGAPLPQRPLRAILQLRTLLEAHSDTADLLAPPSSAHERAIDPPHALPVPGRIPLYAGKGAVVALWGGDSVLHAGAIDRTGISYVRVEERISTVTRLARPSLLRDLLIEDERLFLVWGMPSARCTSPASCTGKSTGIAEVTPPLTLLPEPRWLAAHIAGRVDRSLLAARGDAITIAALAPQGIALRSFGRAEKSETNAPLAPTHASAPAPGEQTLLLGLAQQITLLGFSREEGALALSAHTDRAPSAVHTQSASVLRPLDAVQPARSVARRIGSLPASDAPWVTACTEGERIGVAFGDAHGLVLGEIGPDGTRVSPRVALPLGEPISSSDRTLDRVRRFCVAEGSLASALDRAGALHAVFCPADGRACTVSTLAEQVASYAALPSEGTLLFAYAGGDDAPQIRLRSTDLHGSPRGDERVPGVCWTPGAGMCGQPTLARVGTRIVLGARDATDLVALESHDHGQSWRALHGVDLALPRELVAQAQQAAR